MYLCYVIVESVVHGSTLPFMALLLLEQERITGQLKQSTEQMESQSSFQTFATGMKEKVWMVNIVLFPELH